MKEEQVRDRYERLYEANSRLTAIAIRRAIRKDVKASNVQNLAQLKFIQTDNLRRVLRDRFEKNGKRYGNTVFNELEEQKRFNPVFSRAWAQFVIRTFGDQIGRKISILRDTIADEVAREVRKVIDEGADVVTDLTNEIDKVVSSNTFYRWQAERIARTETTTAMNTATEVAAKETNINYRKQWVSAGDGMERDSHMRLNGQQIEKDGVFSNGLRYPGDPLGSPAEIINCRCTQIYIPIQ